METSSLILRNCDKLKTEANMPGEAVQRDRKPPRLGVRPWVSDPAQLLGKLLTFPKL